MQKTLFGAISFVIVFLCSFVSHAKETSYIVGNGVIKSETRKVPKFHALQCDGAFKIIINAGKEQLVALKGDSNIIPEIKTEVIGEKLRVYSERSYSTAKDLELTINVRNLDEAVISGTHTVNAANISSTALDIEVNGASTFTVSGTAKNFNARINGGSTLLASELVAELVSINITGAGDAEVFARTALNADIVGTGTILYLGTPEVRQNILGVGSISQKK